MFSFPCPVNEVKRGVEFRRSIRSISGIGERKCFNLNTRFLAFLCQHCFAAGYGVKLKKKIVFHPVILQCQCSCRNKNIYTICTKLTLKTI